MFVAPAAGKVEDVVHEFNGDAGSPVTWMGVEAIDLEATWMVRGRSGVGERDDGAAALPDEEQRPIPVGLAEKIAPPRPSFLYRLLKDMWFEEGTIAFAPSGSVESCDFLRVIGFRLSNRQLCQHHLDNRRASLGCSAFSGTGAPGSRARWGSDSRPYSLTLRALSVGRAGLLQTGVMQKMGSQSQCYS